MTTFFFQLIKKKININFVDTFGCMADNVFIFSVINGRWLCRSYLNFLINARIMYGIKQYANYRLSFFLFFFSVNALHFVNFIIILWVHTERPMVYGSFIYSNFCDSIECKILSRKIAIIISLHHLVIYCRETLTLSNILFLHVAITKYFMTVPVYI